jgi:hypothetical protein
MAPQFFNKDFAKQFQHGHELYFPTDEYQYGNLLLKKYNGNSMPVTYVGKEISDKLFQCRLIELITDKLEKDNLPAFEGLYNMTMGSIKECETYMQRELFTSHYYNDFIARLNSFSELIASFTSDITYEVLDVIKGNNPDAHRSSENESIGYPFFDPNKKVIEHYLKNILPYYNYFIVLWRQETEDIEGKGVALTTQVADCLETLIVFTETAVVDIEATYNLLLIWETQMVIKEEQELYN